MNVHKIVTWSAITVALAIIGLWLYAEFVDDSVLFSSNMTKKSRLDPCFNIQAQHDIWTSLPDPSEDRIHSSQKLLDRCRTKYPDSKKKEFLSST